MVELSMCDGLWGRDLVERLLQGDLGRVLDVFSVGSPWYPYKYPRHKDLSELRLEQT